MTMKHFRSLRSQRNSVFCRIGQSFPWQRGNVGKLRGLYKKMRTVPDMPSRAVHLLGDASLEQFIQFKSIQDWVEVRILEKEGCVIIMMEREFMNHMQLKWNQQVSAKTFHIVYSRNDIKRLFVHCLKNWEQYLQLRVLFWFKCMTRTLRSSPGNALWCQMWRSRNHKTISETLRECS